MLKDEISEDGWEEEKTKQKEELKTATGAEDVNPGKERTEWVWQREIKMGR